MSSVALNLSRKWRSQDFDQIVGQDLAVRILKNSLYLGHYFPVYLFAGQRGCGKTSTARIFASAVNCRALSMFQKDPKKSSIPCLVCDSCIAMRDGNFNILRPRRGRDFVGFSWASAKRLLHINTADIRFNRRECDVAMLIDMPHPNRYDVGLHRQQHFPARAGRNCASRRRGYARSSRPS